MKPSHTIKHPACFQSFDSQLCRECSFFRIVRARDSRRITGAKLKSSDISLHGMLLRAVCVSVLAVHVWRTYLRLLSLARAWFVVHESFKPQSVHVNVYMQVGSGYHTEVGIRDGGKETKGGSSQVLPVPKLSTRAPVHSKKEYPKRATCQS